MDNVETTPTETEITPERDTEERSIRDALEQQFDAKEEAQRVEPEKEAVAEDETPTEAEETPSSIMERIPVVPPADMNKAEKEAFLNPTSENAHVLQQYMNRRAYELRSDYQRRMQEVNDLKQQTSKVYDVLKEHEQDYAKQGISIADVTRRSVAWDRAMQANPVATAIEWLDAYGLSVNDLMQQGQIDPNMNGYAYPPQQQNYLTREDAERIAEEKFQAIQAEQQKNAVAYYNERVVDSFLKTKPLFRDPETASQLEAEMAPVVSGLASTGRYSSPEEILETAYNYVVAGNPTFSSINNAVAAKSVAEQKQAVAQKAKAASRSITGSAGSGTPRIQVKDMRDNLRRRMSGE